MQADSEFDIREFLPYLAAQAGDVLSLEFQRIYKGRYGMLRTEWRIVFHLGRYGEMTATEICDRARLHKTKVSRAVTALEAKRFLTRRARKTDRRHADLCLTPAGERVYADLSREAQAFNARLTESLGARDARTLTRCLMKISGLDRGPET